MRPPVDAARAAEFLRDLGRAASRPATVYLVGGSSAVVAGWRASTVDLDLRIEPEDDELLRAISDAIEPALYRFPAVDGARLRGEVDRVARAH